jgi:hypothetical protein
LHEFLAVCEDATPNVRSRLIPVVDQRRHSDGLPGAGRENGARVARLVTDERMDGSVTSRLIRS